MTKKKKNSNKKIDSSQLGESLIPNSRPKEKIERENAIKNLEAAKKIKRVARFAKKGESEFSRSLQQSGEKHNYENMYDMKDAAEYLEMRETTFATRSRKFKIPYEKIRSKKYFKKEDLDEHLENQKFIARK